MLPDNMQLISQMAAKLKKVDERVERLEALEEAHAGDGLGCVSLIDYSWGNGTVHTVERGAACNGNFCWTHFTIWFMFSASVDTDLWLQVNNQVAANYLYEYTYSRNGVTTQAGLAAQTAWFIGQVKEIGETIGRVDFPMYPGTAQPHAMGEWSAYDGNTELGVNMTRGQWSGKYRAGANTAFEFDFFATGAPNITGYVFLYGWCPEIEPGVGPID